VGGVLAAVGYKSLVDLRAEEGAVSATVGLPPS
jgi:hypothetical protein